MAFRKIVQPVSMMWLLFIAEVAFANNEPFDTWLMEFRAEARRVGISERTLEESLSDLFPNEEVIELDRKQPENTKTYEQYIRSVLHKDRIARAIEEYESNKSDLFSVAKQYGVQPEYIVALWGIESNFGERQGYYNVVESLATLAYDGRRSSFFRDELLKSLHIIDEGHISYETMTGSWAGAMGQCQFMPTSFLKFAVDANQDGRKDIWNDTQDVFASIANYLNESGWNGNVGLLSNVSPLSHQTYRKYGKKKATLAEWKKRGITPQQALQGGEIIYSLISGNHDGKGPYFLVSPNFETVLQWNRSRYFALAVGTLANQISAGVE